MKKYLKNKNVQDAIVVGGLGIALMIYSLYMFNHAKVKVDWSMSPDLFPLLLSVMTLLMTFSLFMDGRYEVTCQDKESEGKAEASIADFTDDSTVADKSKEGRKNLLKAGAVVLFRIGYMFLVDLVHFIPATMVFLAVLIWFLGERKWWKIALISILIPLMLYAIFALGLNVRLP